MAMIYLVETVKNKTRENVVIDTFGDTYVKLVHSRHTKRVTSFNNDVLDTIKQLLNEKDVRNNNAAVCIEGGYFKKGNRYFIGDICGIKDRNGTKIGPGLFVEISPNMYYCAKNGNSLRDIITKIGETKKGDFNTFGGTSVLKYLTDDTVSRYVCMAEAVKNAQNNDYNKPFKTIPIISKTDSENFKKLDAVCKDLNRTKN